jgi:uncharacterized protein involved in type VI secretion and phage assembly
MADVALLAIGVKLAGSKRTDRSVFDLVMVQGSEGISMPYSYEVTLFQKKALQGQERKPIKPEEIINTVATIEINRKLEGFRPFHRIGVFEQFEAKGTVPNNPEFRLYSGRIVAPFKMLDREVLFRVFENQNVVTILKECLRNRPLLQPDFEGIPEGKFPTMEYCVQFGESTFAFLSRLMARFGIHYFFSNERDDSENDPQNDLMVFGAEDFKLDRPCVEKRVHIVTDDEFKGEKTSEITAFTHIFDPTYRATRARNFNILAPTKPFAAKSEIDGQVDLAKEIFGPASEFRREEFPAPFDSDDQAEVYVRHRQKQEETTVVRISGRGNNRTFVAGRTFTIEEDSIHTDANNNPEESLKGKSFRLDWVWITAVDPRTKSITVGDVAEDVGLFFADTFGIGSLFKKGREPDLAGSIANHALDEFLKEHLKYQFQKQSGDRKVEAPLFGPVTLPEIITSAGKLFAALFNIVKGAAFPKSRGSFSNSFVATATSLRLPLPVPAHESRTTAYGPHLAVVIGNDGIDSKNGEISADALGRVRVRFPWDRGLVGGQPIGPLTSGKNTCWVRVGQSWASRGFGTQFLPRIGDEVIVEFIDGDPECPIITGSVYNAEDVGKPNLPFAAFKDGPRDFKREDLLAHTGLGTFQRSGIKTQITPSNKKDFHLLRFDDTRGSEQVLMRSQGRYDLTAFRHHFDTTHGNRHILVKGGKDAKGETLAGSSLTTTAGELDLHVGGARYEGIDKVANLTVKADVVHDLQTTSQTMVGTTASLNATKIILEAQAKITLKVGGSFVVVDPCGVFISGPMVQINSGGSPDSTTDADICDPVDATQADPGDPPNFLDLQPKGGGGGGRRKRTVKAKHGFACSMNPDGTIQVTKGIKVNASDPNYASAVIADLSVINNTKKGKALLDSLDGSGRSVSIAPEPPSNPPNASATPTDGAGATNGTGSNSDVGYNPGDWPDPTSRTKAPGDVILFHELTHAQHNAQGTQDNTPRTDNFTDNEEFNTIGPENEYRDERGVPRRRDHADL